MPPGSSSPFAREPREGPGRGAGVVTGHSPQGHEPIRDQAMIGGLSYLDVALVAIVAISGLVAMYRGLTREILSILSWIAAAAACVYFIFKFKAEAQQVAEQFHAPLLVAQVGIGGLIFLVVLIVVHLITSRISDTVLDSRVGAIDRILGLRLRRRAGLRAGGDPLHVLRGVRGQAGAAIPLGARRGLAALHQVDRRFAAHHPAAPGALLADGAGATARPSFPR